MSIQDFYNNLYPTKRAVKKDETENNSLKSKGTSKRIRQRLNLMSLPRPANKRLLDAASQPEIRPLCGPIWLTGELHILFADTGVGKSILAVVIAFALSTGRKVLALENQNEPLKVLLYDFELSDKQAEKRYSDDFTGQTQKFSEGFYYDTIDFIELDEINQDLKLDFDDLLFEKFKCDIETLDIEVLIIDNISFLNQYTTQNTDAALNLMRRLNKLKRETGISILVLAHTPKKPANEPISINHLAGSKHIPNFADSVSALGKSVQDKEWVYWKQVKPSRSAPIYYDSENVLVLEKGKKDDIFLGYEVVGMGQENEHLSKSMDNVREEKIELAKQMKSEGKTLAEIAEEILGDKKRKGTISKWLNR